MPQRGHVHLHRQAEPFERFVLDGHLVADAGVVDEHVDLTELLERFGDETLTVGLVGDVRGDARVIAGQLVGRDARDDRADGR